MKKKSFLRAAGGSIAFVFAFTNILFAHLPQTTLWEQRQKNVQVASLPSALPLQRLTAITESHASISSEGRGSLNISKNAPLPAELLAHLNIRRVSASNTSAKILLIEDIHQNSEAQNHISSALKILGDQKGKDPVLVGLEGANGDFIYDDYKNLPYQDIAIDVANSFFATGDMSGAAHAGFTFHKKKDARGLTFLGIDDAAAYKSNVAAYKDSHVLKAKTIATLDTLKKDLNNRKNLVFAAPLRDFDRSVEAYRDGTLPFGDYLHKLSQIDDTDSLTLHSYLEAYRTEKSLDFSRVDAERREVMEKLVNKLKQNDIDTLINLSLGYQEGVVSFADYYNALRRLCEKNGVDLKNTPHFEKYIQYVLLADSVDAEKLTHDATALENKIYARLTRSAEEKNLVKESKHVYLAQQLVNFSLTSEQWAEYKADAVSGRAGEWEKNLKPFEAFYIAADARSQVMVANLLNTKVTPSPRHPLPPSVIVAGGYHTAELTSLLSKRGLGYIVATPKLTKVDNASGSAYLSVFDREKTPLEKIFEGRKLFLSAPQVGSKNPLDGFLNYRPILLFFVASVAASGAALSAVTLKSIAQLGLTIKDVVLAATVVVITLGNGAVVKANIGNTKPGFLQKSLESRKIGDQNITLSSNRLSIFEGSENQERYWFPLIESTLIAFFSTVFPVIVSVFKEGTVFPLQDLPYVFMSMNIALSIVWGLAHNVAGKKVTHKMVVGIVGITLFSSIFSSIAYFEMVNAVPNNYAAVLIVTFLVFVIAHAAAHIRWNNVVDKEDRLVVTDNGVPFDNRLLDLSIPNFRRYLEKHGVNSLELTQSAIDLNSKTLRDVVLMPNVRFLDVRFVDLNILDRYTAALRPFGLKFGMDWRDLTYWSALHPVNKNINYLNNERLSIYRGTETQERFTFPLSESTVFAIVASLLTLGISFFFAGNGAPQTTVLLATAQLFAAAIATIFWLGLHNDNITRKMLFGAIGISLVSWIIPVLIYTQMAPGILWPLWPLASLAFWILHSGLHIGWNNWVKDEADLLAVRRAVTSVPNIMEKLKDQDFVPKTVWRNKYRGTAFDSTLQVTVYDNNTWEIEAVKGEFEANPVKFKMVWNGKKLYVRVVLRQSPPYHDFEASIPMEKAPYVVPYLSNQSEPIISIDKAIYEDLFSTTHRLNGSKIDKNEFLEKINKLFDIRFEPVNKKSGRMSLSNGSEFQQKWIDPNLESSVVGLFIALPAIILTSYFPSTMGFGAGVLISGIWGFGVSYLYYLAHVNTEFAETFDNPNIDGIGLDIKHPMRAHLAGTLGLALTGLTLILFDGNIDNLRFVIFYFAYTLPHFIYHQILNALVPRGERMSLSRETSWAKDGSSFTPKDNGAWTIHIDKSGIDSKKILTLRFDKEKTQLIYINNENAKNEFEASELQHADNNVYFVNAAVFNKIRADKTKWLSILNEQFGIRLLPASTLSDAVQQHGFSYNPKRQTWTNGAYRVAFSETGWELSEIHRRNETHPRTTVFRARWNADQGLNLYTAIINEANTLFITANAPAATDPLLAVEQNNTADEFALNMAIEKPVLTATIPSRKIHRDTDEKGAFTPLKTIPGMGDWEWIRGNTKIISVEKITEEKLPKQTWTRSNPSPRAPMIKAKREFVQDPGERGDFEELFKDGGKERGGWVDQVFRALKPQNLLLIETIAKFLRGDGVQELVFVGMGGESSVLGGSQNGVTVIADTHPNSFIGFDRARLEKSRWYFVTKSFSTSETLANLDQAIALFKKTGLNPSNHIQLVTDPDSKLFTDKAIAEKYAGYIVKFRELAPTTAIGGRNTLNNFQSLLAYEWTHPGDLRAMLEAQTSFLTFTPDVDQWVEMAYEIIPFLSSGKNKVGLIQPEAMRKTQWLAQQQNVEESLGKNGKGFTVFTTLPDLATLKREKDDRWVFIRFLSPGHNKETESFTRAAHDAGYRVFGVNIDRFGKLEHAKRIAMYGWMQFVAFVGRFWQINPSDQPGVEAYKNLLRKGNLNFLNVISGHKNFSEDNDFIFVYDGVKPFLTEQQIKEIESMPMGMVALAYAKISYFLKQNKIDIQTVAYYSDLNHDAEAMLNTITQDQLHRGVGLSSKWVPGQASLHGHYQNWIAGPMHQVPVHIVGMQQENKNTYQTGDKILADTAVAAELSLRDAKRPTMMLLSKHWLNQTGRERLADFYARVAYEAQFMPAFTGTVPASELVMPIKFGTSGWRAGHHFVEEMSGTPLPETIDISFTPGNVGRTAQAIANMLIDQNKRNARIAVGYDARPKASDFARMVVEVLSGNGFNVDFIEQVTATPIMAEATRKDLPDNERYDLALHITASHNPVYAHDEVLWEGMKVLKDGVPADDAFTAKIAEYANNPKINGTYRYIPFVAAQQAEKVKKEGRDLDLVARSHQRLKSVFDLDLIAAIFDVRKHGALLVGDSIPYFGLYLHSLHGATAEPAKVIHELGIVEKHVGIEPIHAAQLPKYVTDEKTDKKVLWAPDPTKPVYYQGFNVPQGKMGILMDGDGDRAVVIDTNGKEVTPNQLGTIFAHYLYAQGERGSIVRTLPTTRSLDRFAKKNNLKLIQTGVGSKHFGPYADVNSPDSLLVAVEESGHIFFKYKGQIFVDSAVAEAMLITEIMANIKYNSLSDYLAQIESEQGGALLYNRGAVDPSLVTTQFKKDILEIRNILEDRPNKFAEALAQRLNKNVRDLNTLDANGVLVEFDDDTWAMFRLSGTDGSVRIYGEETTPDRLAAQEKTVEEILVQQTQLKEVDRMSWIPGKWWYEVLIAPPLESLAIGVFVSGISSGVTALALYQHFNLTPQNVDGMLFGLFVYMATLLIMSWSTGYLNKSLHGNRKNVGNHPHYAGQVAYANTLFAAVFAIFIYVQPGNDFWYLIGVLTIVYALFHLIYHWPYNALNESEDRMSIASTNVKPRVDVAKMVKEIEEIGFKHSSYFDSLWTAGTMSIQITKNSWRVDEFNHLAANSQPGKSVASIGWSGETSRFFWMHFASNPRVRQSNSILKNHPENPWVKIIRVPDPSGKQLPKFRVFIDKKTFDTVRPSGSPSQLKAGYGRSDIEDERTHEVVGLKLHSPAIWGGLALFGVLADINVPMNWSTVLIVAAIVGGLYLFYKSALWAEVIYAQYKINSEAKHIIAARNEMVEALAKTAPQGSLFAAQTNEMQIRQVAIARAYLEKLKAQNGRTHPIEITLSLTSKTGFIGSVVTIGEDPKLIDADIKLAYRLHREYKIANPEGKIHNILIIREPGLSEATLKKIDALVLASPETVAVIDREQIPLVDGALTYNQAIEVAVNNARKNQKHLAVYEALFNVLQNNGGTADITLRTFNRIPGRYQATGVLEAIWKLIVNDVLVPIQDAIRAAELAQKMA